MKTNPVLKRVRLVAVQATDTVKDAPTIAGPYDVADVARAILPSDREGFAVMHLDARHRVKSVELVSVGTVNASLVHPREVFKAAILAGAVSIVAAHNHPSGDPEPSDEDYTITRRLVAAGDIVGIGLLDHVIVTQTGSVSLRQRDMM
jgi:DNA repair protein RadC